MNMGYLIAFYIALGVYELGGIISGIVFLVVAKKRKRRRKEFEELQARLAKAREKEAKDKENARIAAENIKKEQKQMKENQTKTVEDTSLVLRKLNKLNDSFKQFKLIGYDHNILVEYTVYSQSEYFDREKINKIIYNLGRDKALHSFNKKAEHNGKYKEYIDRREEIIETTITPDDVIKRTGIPTEQYIKTENSLIRNIDSLSFDDEPITIFGEIIYANLAGNVPAYTRRKIKFSNIDFSNNNIKKASGGASDNQIVEQAKKENPSQPSAPINKPSVIKERKLTEAAKIKIVRKTSRVLFKLEELNNLFARYKQVKYSHVADGMDVRNSKKEYDANPNATEWSKMFYKQDVLKLYKAKANYNSAFKTYATLYNKTLDEVETPDEIILDTKLSIDEYRKIEAKEATKEYILRMDRVDVYLKIKVTYTSPNGYSHYEHFVMCDESEFKFDYIAPAVKVDYTTADPEGAKIAERKGKARAKKERYEGMVKMLPSFLFTLQKVSAKKVLLNEIDSHIFELGNVYYFPFGNYALVAGCDEGVRGITISDVITVNGKNIKVTGILENAFKNNNDLKEIIIPDSIQIIGDSAFAGCYQLKDVYIPDSVQYVGDNAFNSCFSLTKVSINEYTAVGNGVFNMCNKCAVEKR